MRAKQLLAAMALALALPAASASAASVTQNFALGGIDAVTAQPFDTSLGTLNSVRFTAGGSVAYDWVAFGPGDVDILLDLSATFDLSGTDSSLVAVFPLFDFKFVFVTLGDDQRTTGLETLAVSRTELFTDPAILARFLPGADNPLITSDMFATLDPGSITADLRGDFGPLGGTASLIYNYTPNIQAVPEPASWALMIIGFGLVGAVQRRRAAGTPAAA
jgi:hypothetical protein